MVDQNDVKTNIVNEIKIKQQLSWLFTRPTIDMGLYGFVGLYGFMGF